MSDYFSDDKSFSEGSFRNSDDPGMEAGSDVRELYQQIILDHNRNPRNFKKPENYNRFSEGHNPLCGDKVTIYLYIDDEHVIRDITFQGSGCAISRASASLMTTTLKGKSQQEALDLFELFHQMLTSGEDSSPASPVRSGLRRDRSKSSMGKLTVLEGVRKYPVRVKCATLAWHTLKNALKGVQDVFISPNDRSEES